MADISGLSRLNFLSKEDEKEPAYIRQLRSYLYQQMEQLQYILSNLDESNLSENMRERLEALERKE